MKKVGSFNKKIVLLAVVVISLFVVHYLFYKEIKSRNQKISILKNDISLKDNRRDYLISTQRLIQDLSIDLQKIDDSIVKPEGDVPFIEKLESMAKDDGLEFSIESLVLEDNRSYENANVKALRVKAKAVGSWKGTYKFLTELESMPIKVKIVRFSTLSSGLVDDPKDVKKKFISWQSSVELLVLKYK